MADAEMFLLIAEVETLIDGGVLTPAFFDSRH